ncbi:SemiSWEET family sugar transporter [Magnetospirillum fulvum]|uniref:MtN3 and saliva related transmembrane protein n=1 Tax=Magnetospirillum fulvum TaxID=1082 RepID=A0A1H6H6Z6_MAGFU|nr:SemiSWEET family transporter [Magnetospirillum fulvum]SEH31216.1 MtN3 and saliva related transmembrane protein [Magnetospirillum fulvum]
MDITPVIGTLAAMASSASFAPQAWKIIKERHTGDISSAMYVLTVSSFGLWLAYGVLRGDLPLIVPNALCLLMSAFILLMSVLPQRKKDEVADVLDPRTEPDDDPKPPKGAAP